MALARVEYRLITVRIDNATIFVVGDTTLDAIQPMLEKEFGKWKAEGNKGTKQIAQASMPEKGQAIIIDRPGAQQSLILAAHLAPPTGADNNIAIETMNLTLGGAFTARVNMNLREDKSWSYDAYTFLQDARGQRPFMVYAPVQTDKTGPSLLEIKKESNAYIGEKPPTADELEDLSKAAEEVLHPEKLTWIIIGDAEKIIADVETADLGSVSVKSMNAL